MNIILASTLTFILFVVTMVAFFIRKKKNIKQKIKRK